MSPSPEHTPDPIAAATRRVTEGFSHKTAVTPIRTSAAEEATNARAPFEGQPSEDPHDSWAPVLLPVSGVRKLGGAGSWQYDRLLGAALDSLGSEPAKHWTESLLVAEAYSRGAPTRQAVARYAGISPYVLKKRMAELQALFGDLPESGLVDRLLREQFLSFSVKGEPPVLDESLTDLLSELVSGVPLNPDDTRYMPLYRALGSARTPAAAVRRAYELQIRKPLGIPFARRMGFHLLRESGVVPVSYPGQPRPRTVYKRAWNMTKLAIEGEIEISEGYALRAELNAAELAVASLAALGCNDEEIAKRTGMPSNMVRVRLKSVARSPEHMRDDKIRHLFESGAFFVTETSLSPKDKPATSR